MKATLTAILLSAISVVGLAQKQNTYYLKNDGSYVTTRDSADFVRIVQEPDAGSDLYNVFDLYKDGSKKLIGKSSTVKPVVFEGQVARFYPNGKKAAVANYHNNQLSGLYYQYFTNGKIYAVLQFREQAGSGTGSYFITTVLDSLGNQLVKEGNGHFKGHDFSDDSAIEEGDVKDGMRDGDWKGTVASLNIEFKEHYDQGKLIYGISTDKAGKEYRYTERYSRPFYKDGNKALFTFLENQMNFFAKDEIVNVKGTPIFSFFVEGKGKLSHITISNIAVAVSNPAVETMEDYLLKAAAASAKGWLPATSFGVPHRQFISFPYSIRTADNIIFY